MPSPQVAGTGAGRRHPSGMNPVPSRYGSWRMAAERLQQNVPLTVGEVGGDQLAVQAVQAFAEPIQVAFLGDEEQRRGALGDLGPDLFELVAPDAGALGGFGEASDA